MTDQELFESIKQIVEQEVVLNWNADVINSATVAQLIMNLLLESRKDAQHD